jgi:hypothetical protein
MKTARCVATALALFLAAACTDGAPTAPPEPEMTEARFLELHGSALQIANRIQAQGSITTEDRIELDAIGRELIECMEGSEGSGLLHASSIVGPDAGLVAAAPTNPLPTKGCQPCPFMIMKGSCIGVIRSWGPCRPGAGLERCFYTWYCSKAAAS